MNLDYDVEKTLLIIGAGEHSHVVREIGEAVGYKSFYYLDDKKEDALVLGNICELPKFKDRFRKVFISIGDNGLRMSLFIEALKLGYQIPTLISPSAYVSKSADIGVGCLICPLSCVQANVVIERGCFISSGAILDHNTKIGEFSHINAGVVCMSGVAIKRLTKANNDTAFRK